ncbi:flagellar hook-length control protein FliK [Geobacter sp. SVR]|uniref:flagellar hook-length control protein FliK n=1 Tax=Geobacter sp. SVR TaxID=2495594 RepID=UPI00143EF5BD|nr:flagellar hook-length control protein FliK [Geobacter sp. SVR]BCS55838.1 hypothetical protein GSVR_41460 [Geobacter sp. SVR]GCF83842.1 hypothetical protein GSbR_04420 [Geobacter sp. SVR]
MALTADVRQQVFDLLSRASTLSFVSADSEIEGVLGLRPGQPVMAEVLTTLPNQLVQVQIGNERLNLDLPMAVRAGQVLEMTYVADTPRATFAIARPADTAPAVTLSDASRLLGLLVGNEQLDDPQLRSSLQSVGDLLRQAPGEAGVLANLMDEALTYGSVRDAGMPRPSLLDRQSPPGSADASAQPPGNAPPSEQSRLALFEANASQVLQQIARNSRFVLSEAVNAPVVPLPLMSGQEVDAVVQGSLPGGRTFIQVAGAELELVLPRAAKQGEILRLTFISAEPKPLFAVPRSTPGSTSGELSEAGRWLSALEHSDTGVSGQQMYVLERLNTVLKSLPADSPAFAAIRDEAVTYQPLLLSGGRSVSDEQAAAAVSAAITPGQALPQPGSGLTLSDEMIKLLQALIRGNRLALLEALNQQPMSAGLVPGQQFKAEVLATLGGGRFMVQVAGQAFEFVMPKGTRTGSLATLFFITDDPRPTFLLTRFGKPEDSRVSDTGRWLSGFLAATAEKAPVRTTLGLLRALMDAPPTDAPLVGKMLQQGVQESGLFYESHLSRWFGGDYPLADILREPQGRLSHLHQPAVMGNSGSDRPEDAETTGTAPMRAEVAETMFRKAGALSERDFIADRGMLPVVREQLAALQNGQVAFSGELFPGQPMEWTVQEREARRNSDGERERTWETTLRLDLPHLGLVKARLVMDGHRVSIDLRTGAAETAARLDRARPELAEQLQAAGLAPDEIGIRYDSD